MVAPGCYPLQLQEAELLSHVVDTSKLGQKVRDAYHTYVYSKQLTFLGTCTCTRVTWKWQSLEIRCRRKRGRRTRRDVSSGPPCLAVEGASGTKTKNRKDTENNLSGNTTTFCYFIVPELIFFKNTNVKDEKIDPLKHFEKGMKVILKGFRHLTVFKHTFLSIHLNVWTCKNRLLLFLFFHSVTSVS